MTALEQLKQWLSTYPDYDILGALKVDFTDQIPNTAGLFPSGLVAIDKTEDLVGNAIVENQLNFALYIVFEKSPGDEISAVYNADWVLDFQDWVQEQSARHLIPPFGNYDERRETVSAQNGVLYDTLTDTGTALYVVQIAVNYKKIYKE